MTKDANGSFESICNKISSYYPEANLEIIHQAYVFAAEAHRGQLRSSGEPYMVHPIEVAQTLADLKLDLPSIATGLLHDTVEDTHATLVQIEAKFGKDIAELVDGVTKLSKIAFKSTAEKQAENFRKMILAMAKDIRVILVKLSDRLNNMRTLEHLNQSKQQKITQETLEMYAPIANRLGIGWIKIELEDLCLKYSHPEVYEKLSQKLEKTSQDRERFIEETCSHMNDALIEYNVQTQVSGRAKHFYSIYKKMERRDIDFEQVFDLIAFKIIVDNITDCYKSLGVIHTVYKPVPGRFKDYIAIPKANSYQSLHTTVISPTGERIEIQIRTQDMDQTAEGGITAHWKYKEGKFNNQSRENRDWIQRLLEWQKDLSDPLEFLETVKNDLFAEDVFVLTPKGEVKQLTHGSTPLDFAYNVHTDIGNKCVGAKVNGKIISLKSRLKSGDTIEIITNSSQTPSKEWLKIVKRSQAKARIRSYIKTQERATAIELGKKNLETTLKLFECHLSQIENSVDFLTHIKKNYHLSSLEEVYTAVCYGRIKPENFIQYIVPKKLFEAKIKLVNEKENSFLNKIFNAAKTQSEKMHTVKVANMDDVLIRFAHCCRPIPGDPIIGFMIRGRGVSIHISSCTKALDNDQQSQVEVAWNLEQKIISKSEVRIRVLSLDQPGLLAVLSQNLYMHQVNLVSAHIRTTKDKKAIFLFGVKVIDFNQLSRVIHELEKNESVISVERVKA